MRLMNLFIVGSMALLGACNYTSSTSSDVSVSAANGSLQNLPHGIARKSSAPVNVSYQLLDSPRLGIPMRIEIGMKPLAIASEMKLEYALEGNLVSGDPSRQVSFGNVTPGQIITNVIHISPQGEGQHFVNVFVTLLTQDGQARSTALMIPVTVGGSAAIQKREHPDQVFIQQGAQGQAIIAIPAEETTQ